jgi:hypothetical protein
VERTARPPLSKLNPERILKGSFLLSVIIYFNADKGDIAGRLNGIYVGIWVPSILALGAFVLSAMRLLRVGSL